MDRVEQVKRLNTPFKKWLRRLANWICKKAYGVTYMGIVSKIGQKTREMDRIAFRLGDQVRINKKLLEALRTEEYHTEQKIKLVAKKQGKIDHLNSLIRIQQDQMEIILNQSYKDLANRDEMVNGCMSDIKEYRRRLKCLNEMIRIRNKKIEKLKKGIEIPVAVQIEKDKNKTLTVTIAQKRAEIYSLKKQIRDARQYIKDYIKKSGKKIELSPEGDK